MSRHDLLFDEKAVCQECGNAGAHDFVDEMLCMRCAFPANQSVVIDREAIAAVQHEIWPHWMTYLFSMCNPNEDGTYTIPEELARCWMRQMAIPYACLAEHEKQSDRDQADRVIAAIRALPLEEEKCQKMIGSLLHYRR